MIGLVVPELGGIVGLGLAVPGGVAEEPDFNDPTPGGTGGGTLLDLDASPEAVAWAEFVRLVRDQPDLRRIGVAFRTWDGSEGDDTVPSSASETPWLRFSPMPGRRERWSTGNVWHAPILVHVDQITPLAVMDSLNLYGVLMRLIESPAFQSAMGEAGASSVWFDEGGYGERPNLAKTEPNPDGTITAIGTITIDLYIEYTED